MKKLMNKKLIAIVLSFAFLLMPLAVFAGLDTGINEAADIGLGNADVKDIVNNIITLLLGFLGLIAVIIILIGGFMWMTAGGNEEKVGKGRKYIINGIIGLVIVLAAYAIAAWVISSLQTTVIQ